MEIINLFKNILCFGSVTAIIAALVMPLQYLKINRQQTSKQYVEIFQSAYKSGGFKKLYSGIKPFILFYSLSTVAFAISEFISIGLLSIYGIENSILGFCIRGITALVFEVILTIQYELQVLTKSKGKLMKQTAKISSIIAPASIRNFLNWVGVLSASYIIIYNNLSYSDGFVISFIFGIVFAIITLPFDVVVVHSCGDDRKRSIRHRIKGIISKGGFSSIYSGVFMRVMIRTCFSVGFVIVGRLLYN